MTTEKTQNSPSSDSPVIKLFLTFGRGLAYAICIWGVYLVLQSQPSNNSSDDQQRAAQFGAYQEQMTRWKEQNVESEKQLMRASSLLSKQEAFEKRAAELLSKQEDQAKRFDVVISAWEQQSGVKK
jgi:hypothetical protein